jgi:hypothetical protein
LTSGTFTAKDRRDLLKQMWRRVSGYEAKIGERNGFKIPTATNLHEDI